MSHPDWGDWGAPLPADDGEDELYNPITYETDDPVSSSGDSTADPSPETDADADAEAEAEAAPDTWDPGRSGGGVPMAGEDRANGGTDGGSGGGTAPSRWASAGWVPAQQATPVQRSTPVPVSPDAPVQSATAVPLPPDAPVQPATADSVAEPPPQSPPDASSPAVDPTPTVQEPIAAEFRAPEPVFPRSGAPSVPTFTPYAPPRSPTQPEGPPQQSEGLPEAESPAQPDSSPWPGNPPRSAGLADDVPTTIRPVVVPPPGPREGGAWPNTSWPDESWPPRVERKARPPRWVIAVAAVVIVAAGTVGTAFALGGSPGTSTAGSRAGASAAPSAHPAAAFPPGMTPAITPSAAKAVLAQYTASNNTANARMDPGLLGGFKTGSSQAIDKGSYARQKAAGSPVYPAFGPASTQLYIPLEPSGYPHWFAAKVANQALGGKHQGLGTEYLLFTKSSASAPWKNADEQYLLGGATAPAVSLDPEGYATTVAFTAPGLSVSPSQLAQQTASSLDGHGPVSGPGNLTETSTANLERTRLPQGTRISDTHTQTGYGIVGLRTSDGGALLFYTDAAIVTFTAPHGKSFTMPVPGFYNGKETLHWAGLRILDQLATYDPPAGHGKPRVIADYSGVQERL